MRRRVRGVFILYLLLPMVGCAGHFVVKPAQPGDPGFHYWSPEPYLLVTNAATAAAPPKDCSKEPADKKKDCEDEAAQAAAKPAPLQVNVQLIYLPGQEYAVTTEGGGIGTFKGGIQLTNGWMLTGVNEESDAKVAETISAVANLVKAGAAFAPSISGAPSGASPKAILYLFWIDTKNKRLVKVDTNELLNLLQSR